VIGVKEGGIEGVVYDFAKRRVQRRSMAKPVVHILKDGV
jgi:hypothetical protein